MLLLAEAVATEMADVFISYARSTEDQAQKITKALRALGYEVWRDDELPAHRDYTTVIEEHLHAAKAVVVAWSAEAVKSRWVCAEADVAHEAGVLIQLTLDGSTPPLPFNRIQCADMTGWSGEDDSPGWRKVVRSVADLAGPKPALEAPEEATATPVRPLTGAAARWASIAGSLDTEDYADFLQVFPQSEEAFEARRQKRRLDAWLAIDQANLPAVLAFLKVGSFPALQAVAQSVAADLADLRLAQPPAPAPAPAPEAVPEPAPVSAAEAPAEPALQGPADASAQTRAEPAAPLAVVKPEPVLVADTVPAPAAGARRAPEPAPAHEAAPIVAEAASIAEREAAPETTTLAEARSGPATAAPGRRSAPLMIGAAAAAAGALGVGALVLMAGPKAPLHAAPSVAPTATPPTRAAGPAISVQPVADDADGLVGDAQHLGRPSQELGALTSADSKIKALVAQITASPAGARAALVAQLDTLAAGASKSEAATLTHAADSQLREAQHTLAGAGSQTPGAGSALAALQNAESHVASAAATVPQAADADASLQAARQTLAAYGAFATADTAATRFFAPARRAEFARVSAEAHTLASRIATLAATPKPWLFASSSRKQAYQQLQTDATSAKAEIARLDALSASIGSASDAQATQAVGEANRVRQALSGLYSAAMAAAQAAK